MDGQATIVFFFFFEGVRPILLMEIHATCNLFFFFFFFCPSTFVPGRTCNHFFFFFGVMDGHATSFSFFFWCPSTFVHGRTCNHLFFFFLGVHPLFFMDEHATFFFGRGLVEVTKSYLVTLLVVHLESWTC